MPTYQYVCTSCEAPLEVVQSFSDPSLTECPACDGGKLRKVFSAVGVVFKGSGFYRTDNRAGGESAQPRRATRRGRQAGPREGRLGAGGQGRVEGGQHAVVLVVVVFDRRRLGSRQARGQVRLTAAGIPAVDNHGAACPRG